jgi:hypothetical protein
MVARWQWKHSSALPNGQAGLKEGGTVIASVGAQMVTEFPEYSEAARELGKNERGCLRTSSELLWKSECFVKRQLMFTS